MKNIDYQPQDFRELSGDEKFACTGGGFAYDVGRYIRFSIICGGGNGIHMAILDACLVQL